MYNLRFCLFILLLFSLFKLSAQTTADYTIQVSAIAQSNPPLMTFSWSLAPNATAYTVYRKLKSQPTWTLVTNLSGTATGYTDNTLNVGDAYEYRFDKTEPTHTGYGFIYAGIEAPLIEFRGKVIVVTDTSIMGTIQAEHQQFLLDLVGDGYEVIRLDIDRNDPVAQVKNQIVNIYSLDTGTTKTLVLLGRVPVPYSGNLAPDAHIPDHEGAWPADVFYGDMDGTWTDATVSNTGATRTQNHNVPGDGKYDESIIPSDVELMLGRIDLSNMNTFALSEADLIKQYLQHNHAFRTRAYIPQTRARVDDNFGAFSGEAFAANGYRNFAPLVGFANVSSGDYFPDLVTQDFLFSYGCGAGSYTSAGGVGNTGNFVADTVQTTFTSLFGSYFGDWDSNNNFLRAPLAAGRALASFWAGRPHWQIHHMGLGEPIGYGTRLSQNNQNIYFAGAFPRRIHIALMGDPTLRMQYINPPSALVLSPANNQNHVLATWTAAAGTVLGYHLYAGQNELGPYTRVNTQLITATTFTDTMPRAGVSWYMVRAVNLDTTASGTFYNASQGILSSITLTPSITTNTVQPLLVCPGDSVDVSFAITGPFWWNNTFTAEISDATGSFAVPLTMGTLPGNTPLTFRVEVPPGLNAGTLYRIRVRGNQPSVITGSDNGQDIEIQLAPPAPALSNNGPLCPGDDLVLSTSNTGTAFLWTGPNGYSSTNQNPQINNVTMSYAGVYSLIYSTGLCFSAPGTTQVLFSVPVPATAMQNGPVCAGDSLLLNAPSFPNASYQWTGPGGQTLQGQNATMSAAFLPASGTWILLISQNGCMLATDTFQVLIHPIPLAPLISWDGTTLTSGEPQGNVWHLNGQELPGATQQTYVPSQSGAYHVIYTDTNNCSVTSLASIVYMTSMENGFASVHWSLFPNPAKEYMQIEGMENHQDFVFLLYDFLGKEIRLSVYEAHNGSVKLRLPPLTSGIYTLYHPQTGFNAKVRIEP